MKYQAVIFDWAGTMIDFGSFAPMGVFVEAFKQFEIEISIAQAREPMGMPKWQHIEAMFANPLIAQQWQERYGHAPNKAAIDQVYDVFVPMNEAVVANYAELVPGALPMLQQLAQYRLKVGSTTGYTRSIMEQVIPVAAAQGYQPLNVVCADDLPFGRPTALGMYKCCLDLAVAHTSLLIKVDDTAPGIAEGVAAGCLTVGVALSGNYVGKTPEELAALSAEQVQALRKQATQRLQAAGADYVIDTVADLPVLLEKLSAQHG